MVGVGRVMSGSADVWVFLCGDDMFIFRVLVSSLIPPPRNLRLGAMSEFASSTLEKKNRWLFWILAMLVMIMSKDIWVNSSSFVLIQQSSCPLLTSFDSHGLVQI